MNFLMPFLSFPFFRSRFLTFHFVHLALLLSLSAWPGGGQSDILSSSFTAVHFCPNPPPFPPINHSYTRAVAP